MEFQYNREKAELLRVMKSKGEKQKIHIEENGDKLFVRLENGKFTNGEEAVPVQFSGKVLSGEGSCSLKGQFSYGFYLTVMVIVAALLIVARFVWSLYQHQTSNMVLCAVVAALLLGVIIVANIKARPAKKVITDFLSDLNVK